MKRQFLAIELGRFKSLQATRAELLDVARSLGTADAMRSGIAEIMASATLLRTPTTAEERAQSYTVDAQGVAHIPILGVLTPRVDDSPCAAFDQGAETEYGFITTALLAADTDPRVQLIQAEIDSGGGYVDGCDACAQVINSLTKPTRAVVSNCCASGALWLATQFDQILASSPADKIGSIGVVVEYLDDTKALANKGIEKHTLTSTDAPNKRPDLSTDDGQAQIIAQLDATHAVFVDRVAHGRGVSIDKVNADFGQGGLMSAAEAVKVGLIDGVQGQVLKNRKNPGVAGAAVKTAQEKQEVVEMDITTLTADELAKARPDLVAALGKPSGDQALKSERDRVAELETQLGISPEVDAIVAEAKATGATYGQVMARINAAALKAARPLDNPALVGTQPGQSLAGEGEVKQMADMIAAGFGDRRKGA